MKVYRYHGQDCYIVVQAPTQDIAFRLVKDKLLKEGRDDNIGIDELRDMTTERAGIIEFIDERLAF